MRWFLTPLVEFGSSKEVMKFVQERKNDDSCDGTGRPQLGASPILCREWLPHCVSGEILPRLFKPHGPLCKWFKHYSIYGVVSMHGKSMPEDSYKSPIGQHLDRGTFGTNLSELTGKILHHPVVGTLISVSCPL
jgi:hypothetical protein